MSGNCWVVGVCLIVGVFRCLGCGWAGDLSNLASVLCAHSVLVYSIHVVYVVDVIANSL